VFANLERSASFGSSWSMADLKPASCPQTWRYCEQTLATDSNIASLARCRPVIGGEVIWNILRVKAKTIFEVTHICDVRRDILNVRSEK